MSTDAERVALAITNLHGLWSSPLRIIVALILLGFQLGWAAVCCFFAILINFSFFSYLNILFFIV